MYVYMYTCMYIYIHMYTLPKIFEYSILYDSVLIVYVLIYYIKLKCSIIPFIYS